MDEPNCNECPLKGTTKVFSSGKPKNFNGLAIVESFPSFSDIEEQKLFTANAGYFLSVCARENNMDKEDIFLTTSVACHIPKSFKPKQWKKAIECCAPRLHGELKEVAPAKILTQGKQALFALDSSKEKLTLWWGGFLDSKYGEFLPSFSHNDLFVKPALIPIARRVFKRILSSKRWVWPRYEAGGGTAATTAALEELRRSSLPLAIDIENVGDPLNSRIRCIGVATKELGCSVPTEPSIYVEHRNLLQKMFYDSKRTKVFHNGQHDILGLESHGYIFSGPIEDTLLLHSVIAPQLPHNLGFCAAAEFNAPRWKSTFGEDENKGGKKKNIEDKFESATLLNLMEYNVKDALMTALLYERFLYYVQTTF
mgnify:CR=1 FL=1